MTLDTEIRNALVEKEANSFMDMLTPEYFEPEAKELKKRLVDYFTKLVISTKNIKDENEIEKIRNELENKSNTVVMIYDVEFVDSFHQNCLNFNQNNDIVQNFDFFDNMIRTEIYLFLRFNYASFEELNKEIQERSNLKNYMSENDSAYFDKYSKIILDSSKKKDEIINKLVEIAKENGIEKAIQDDSINSAIKYVFPTLNKYKNFLIEFYINKTKFAELISKQELNEEELLNPVMIIVNEASKLSGKFFKDYIEKRAKEIYE